MGVHLQTMDFRVASHLKRRSCAAMTLTLPDDPALDGLAESDIRLDLACALFAGGRISRSVGARMAGMERFDFDAELVRRKIPSFTEEMLEEDLATLRKLFPK